MIHIDIPRGKSLEELNNWARDTAERLNRELEALEKEIKEIKDGRNIHD